MAKRPQEGDYEEKDRNQIKTSEKFVTSSPRIFGLEDHEVSFKACMAQPVV